MKTRALLVALPVLVFVAASCSTENRGSIDIQALCAPTDTCTFGATCDKNIIGSVTMDVGLRRGAPLVLQVGNRLLDNADKSAGRVNTNDAHVDQVAVEYTGIALPGFVYDSTNQYVPANGSSVLAINAVSADATTSATLVAAIAGGPKNLVAKVKLKGYLTDGSRFETGEFPTAIQICDGCLTPDPCPGKAACPGIGMEPVACGTTGG